MHLLIQRRPSEAHTTKPTTPLSSRIPSLHLPPYHSHTHPQVIPFSSRSKAAYIAFIKILHELTPPQLYDMVLIDQDFLKWPAIEWSVREYIQENQYLCTFCYARYPSLRSYLLHSLLNHIREAPRVVTDLLIRRRESHRDPLHKWMLG